MILFLEKKSVVCFYNIAPQFNRQLLLYYLADWSWYFSLQYTALLRLPGSMPTKEKKRRVNEIIDDLDMRKCLNTSEWCYIFSQDNSVSFFLTFAHLGWGPGLDSWGWGFQLMGFWVSGEGPSGIFGIFCVGVSGASDQPTNRIFGGCRLIAWATCLKKVWPLKLVTVWCSSLPNYLLLSQISILCSQFVAFQAVWWRPISLKCSLKKVRF